MSEHDDQTGAGQPGGPKRPRRPSSRKRPSAPGSHDVGYGKPPQEHQFRPGQSGNPKGRPVGSKNKPPTMPTRIKDIILHEAYRPLPVREGEEQVSIPIVQASLRAMGIRAVKGDTRAQWQLARLAQQAEAQHERERFESAMSFAEAKMIGEQEVARRKQRGITDTSDIIPHPDHIHIDPRTMTVEIRGPMSAEERREWLAYLEVHKRRVDLRKSLRASLAAEPDPEARARLESFLDECDTKIAQEEAQVPDWWHITE